MFYLKFNDKQNLKLIKSIYRVTTNDSKSILNNKIINESKLSNHIDSNFRNSIVRVTVKKINHGACFSGVNSYFYFDDVHTMKRINNNQVDLNVRFKSTANSSNGLILWAGKKASDEYFLMLGIVDG